MYCHGGKYGGMQAGVLLENSYFFREFSSSKFFMHTLVHLILKATPEVDAIIPNHET